LYSTDDLIKSKSKSLKELSLNKPIRLKKGKNDVIVRVVDKSDNRSEKILSIYRVESVGSAPKIATRKTKISKQGNFYAVVIGIGNYKDSRIPKLKYTTVDAEGIYNALINPEYTNIPKDKIKLLLNEKATYQNIKSAIGTWLRRNTKQDDTVILFYAGHGALEEDKAYWVTYNADIDDLYGTSISNDEIADLFDRIKTKRLVAFLDSCYSKATINRTAKGRSTDPVTEPFKKFQGKGRVIITSSDGKQESLELDNLKHGVFSYYLLNALKGNADNDNDGIVLLDEVWDYVKTKVPETAKKYGAIQTPMISGSYSAGIPLSKNPIKLRELEEKLKHERQQKEMEEKISFLKNLYLNGEISSKQFDRAIMVIKSQKTNKLIDDLIKKRISIETFSAVF